MGYNSVFDIIGPVMVGPSSSHTAGAVVIANVARNLFGEDITWARIHLYESFAKTYKGHRTDAALISGLLGFNTGDSRILNALQIAKDKNIDFKFIEESTATEHPNTVRLCIGNDKNELELMGISIGGGKAQIKELNGFELKLSGNHPAVLITHNNRYGTISSITEVFTKHKINISHMEVNRKKEGMEALMIVEADQDVGNLVLEELQKTKHIIHVSKLIT